MHTRGLSGQSGTWGLGHTALLKAKLVSIIHSSTSSAPCPPPRVTGLHKAPGIPTVTPKFLSSQASPIDLSYLFAKEGARSCTQACGARAQAPRLSTWPPSCAPAPRPPRAMASCAPPLASRCFSPLFLTASAPPPPCPRSKPHLWDLLPASVPDQTTPTRFQKCAS